MALKKKPLVKAKKEIEHNHIDQESFDYNDISPPKVEMSSRDRVKLMNALASAPDNEKLKEAFLSLDKGPLIYEIFILAIEKEIDNIMNPGTKEQVDAINEATMRAQGLNALLSQLASLPVLTALCALHNNLDNSGPQLTPATINRIAGQFSANNVVTQNKNPTRNQEVPVFVPNSVVPYTPESQQLRPRPISSGSSSGMSAEERLRARELENDFDLL